MIVKVNCVCGKVFEKDISPEIVKNARGGVASVFATHEDHAVIIYIDEKFKVRGVEPVAIDPKDKELLMQGSIPLYYRVVPSKAKFPPMIKELGLISPEEARVLEEIDGKKNLIQLSKALGMSIERTREIVIELHKKKLIKIETLPV